MSRIFMLKPADGIEGVKEVVLTSVREIPNSFIFFNSSSSNSFI